MKKILLMLMFALPFTCLAKKEKVNYTPYLKGAVPEVNGIVTFQKAFAVPGKSSQEIYGVMKAYVNQLVETSIPAPGPYARISEDVAGQRIVAQVCEWQVYKDKFLNKDQSRFRYTLAVSIEAGKVSLEITRLTYYYMENQQGEEGTVYRAEEWISDSAALNRAGTKLLPKSKKFRKATCDRVEALTNDIMDAFEAKIEAEKQQSVPAQKIRAHVRAL